MGGEGLCSRRLSHKVVMKLDKKEYQRSRNINLSLRVSEKERKLIEQKMKLANMSSLRAYIVKQAIDGHVIHIELDSVNEMVRLLSNATNNINQIARRANETGSIYAADIEEIRARMEEMWTQVREILRRLSALQ